MIGIVIVANGNLAVEMFDCLENILGKQPYIIAIPVENEHDRKTKENEICDAICRVDVGQGVVVVTDIYGSSPANLSICACKNQKSIILTGMNLPMLIKLVQSRHMSLSKTSGLAFTAGRNHIRKIDGN